jgi:hypothetical protein
MTPDRTTRLDSEREVLRQAIARLLAGTPHRSNGTLTVTTLAVEAGLPRHRLYEHHAELVAEFKTNSGGGPISPTIAALRRQLADAHDRIQYLEAAKTELQDRIIMLSAVITELSHEAHADNIVALPPRRHTRTRSPRP